MAEDDSENLAHLMPAPQVVDWMRENSAEDISDLSDEELVARWTTQAPPARTATQQLLAGLRMHISDEIQGNRLASWYAVAKRLGVKNQRVYQWKEGRSAMPDEVISRACRILYGSEPEDEGMHKRWLCDVAAERARRIGDEHHARLWKEMAKRFICLASPLLLWLPTDVEALAAQAERQAGNATINIMLNRIRQALRRLVGQRVRPWFARDSCPVCPAHPV